MKKIKIKFLGLGYFDVNQAIVDIYDMKGAHLYHKITNNNEICLYLEERNIYRIIANNNYNFITKTFYVKNDDVYIFSFYNNILDNTSTVTFLLKDYFYNMPIMKGEIILNG